MKEPLINLDDFWQRQVSKFEALFLKHSHSMVEINNKEIGNLAKPRRVKPQGIISVVALLVKAISIPYKARLGYDALESYRIHLS